MSHIEVRTSPSGELVDVGDNVVISVFGRLGAVVAELDDYSASLVDNDSSVAGATVADALNTLAGAIPAIGGADTNVQFNDSGSFSGVSGLTFAQSGGQSNFSVRAAAVSGGLARLALKDSTGVSQLEVLYTQGIDVASLEAVAPTTVFKAETVTYLTATSTLLLLGGLTLAVRQNAPSVVFTKTASYTVAIGDIGAFIDMNVAGANNFTVPLNSVVAFPIGTLIYLTQIGAGLTTVVATGGVTINTNGKGLIMLGTGAFAMLRKTAADTWLLTGEITA